MSKNYFGENWKHTLVWCAKAVRFGGSFHCRFGGLEAPIAEFSAIGELGSGVLGLRFLGHAGPSGVGDSVSPRLDCFQGFSHRATVLGIAVAHRR